MKYFLIGFAVWFAIAWLPQFIRAWFLEIVYQWEKKHAKRDKKWMYE